MDVREKQGIVLHIIGCLLIFYSGFLFGGGNVPDFFRGAGQVREELERTEEYQREAEQGVKDAANTAGSVADAIEGSRETIREAEGTVGRIEVGNQRAGELIADSQQIIETVRRRGKVQAP